MGRKWVNRETNANGGIEQTNRWTNGWRAVWKEKHRTKAVDEAKRVSRERSGGSTSESGSVAVPKSGIGAKCQQKIARTEGLAGWRRNGRAETGREGAKEGVGRFVPAWLPSLGWWAIAALRAPMRPSGGADTGFPLCTDYALSLCTDYALSGGSGSGVGSWPGKLQVLSSLLRYYVPAYIRLRNQATLFAL